VGASSKGTKWWCAGVPRARKGSSGAYSNSMRTVRRYAAARASHERTQAAMFAAKAQQAGAGAQASSTKCARNRLGVGLGKGLGNEGWGKVGRSDRPEGVWSAGWE